MSENAMTLYRRRKRAAGEFSKTVPPPPAMNDRLESLKSLTKSMMSELALLTEHSTFTGQSKINLSAEVQRFELGLIRWALIRTEWRQRRAADILGIKPTTLHEKMKRYGLFESYSDGELAGRVDAPP